MKRVIWCAILLFLLVGCQQPEEAVSCVAEAELSRLEGELAGAGEASLALQENLAMWYNQNLREENDPAFREAYGSILFYSDGVMGSLEVPGKAIHLPIYHGLEGKSGFGHDPDTPFPIGQIGSHPVLVTGEAISLSPGDTFVIHILEADLTYQVTAVRKERDTTAVPGMDYCSLILENGYQILGIRVDGSEN